MRMWMIDPKFMCKRHISGEHGEIHKHLPGLYQGVGIAGRFEPVVQIELWQLQMRHDWLAGYLRHGSPLEVDECWLWKLYPGYYYRRVDLEYNILDLAGRCADCRDRLREGGLV